MKNRTQSALMAVAREAERLHNSASFNGHRDTAFAFQEIATMLTSLALNLRSPLLDELTRRVAKNGHGLAYQQAKRSAKALALMLLTRTTETRYSACKTASAHSGISMDILERELPKDAAGIEAYKLTPEGRELLASIEFDDDEARSYVASKAALVDLKSSERPFDHLFWKLVEDCENNKEAHLEASERRARITAMMAEEPSFQALTEAWYAARRDKDPYS